MHTVVEAVAEVKQIATAAAAEQIAKNFECFFNIKLAQHVPGFKPNAKVQCVTLN